MADQMVFLRADLTVDLMVSYSVAMLEKNTVESLVEKSGKNTVAAWACQLGERKVEKLENSMVATWAYQLEERKAVTKGSYEAVKLVEKKGYESVVK